MDTTDINSHNPWGADSFRRAIEKYHMDPGRVHCDETLWGAEKGWLVLSNKTWSFSLAFVQLIPLRRSLKTNKERLPSAISVEELAIDSFQFYSSNAMCTCLLLHRSFTLKVFSKSPCGIPGHIRSHVRSVVVNPRSRALCASDCTHSTACVSKVPINAAFSFRANSLGNADDKNDPVNQHAFFKRLIASFFPSEM